MKRLLLALAFLLGGLVEVGAQSSVQGGGLSTKAIQALEECFDSADNFICTGAGGTVSGTGTNGMGVRWIGANTIDDGTLFDDGSNVSVPDDNAFNFGTSVTTGTIPNISLNTFGGGGTERLEIDAIVNAGILITHGDGSTGGFNVTDGSGSFTHVLTQNPPIASGASGPSWILAATGVSSMDDAADQRTGLDVDMESGATDVADSQQIGVHIEGPVARASTQDGLLIGSTWDNQIVVGDETNRTALNWEAVSGLNTVTVPADTGTIALEGSITGTANRLSKFDSGGIGLVDSNITDFGTTMFIEPVNFLQIEPDGTGNTLFQLNPRPAAGTGAEIFNMGFTLNAMDGTDTNNLLQISLTNADHTGASNFINALNINSMIGDAEADETAINIEIGWENFMRVAEDISNEATFQLDDLTADRTYTFPDATGTVLLDSSVSGTLNNVAKFTPDGSAVGDANITDDGTTITWGVGASGNSMLLQADGSVTELVFDDDVEFESSDSISMIIADNDFFFLFDAGFGTIYEIKDDPTSGALFRLRGDFNQGGATGANNVQAFRIDPEGPPSGLTSGTWTGLQIDTGSGADHSGGTIRGIEIANISGDVDTQEDALTVQGGWDRGLVFAGLTLEIATTAGDLDVLAAGSVDIDATSTGQHELGDNFVLQQDPPAASSSGNILELTGAFNNVGGGNIQSALEVNVDPVAVAAGTVYGIHIPTQDSDDSSETGAALAIGDWSGGNPLRDVIFTKTLGNSEIVANTGFEFILDENNTQGVNTQVSWNESTTAVSGSLVNYNYSAQVGTMDGSDTYIGLQMNAFQNTNPTGSDNNVRMFQADNIVNRSGAVQTSYYTSTGYDYFAQMPAGTTSPPDPGANTVGFFIDEGTDRVGGGSNDCVLVARLSDGTELNVAVLVTDGGCP